MKISIEGSAKVVDGGIAKSRMIGQGSSARNTSLLFHCMHLPPKVGIQYSIRPSRTGLSSPDVSRTAHTGYAAGKSYSCQT